MLTASWDTCAGTPPTARKRKKTLVSHLLAVCGKTGTEADVMNLIEGLRKAGHLTIGDRDAVTYHD